MENASFQNPNTPGGYPPKNWLVESILVTLFCCLPLGIVGIINAAGVEGKFMRGDIAGAEKSAATAKQMVMISAIAGVVGILIYMFFLGGLALFGATNN